VFCNLITFLDYIIIDQQGVKHWKYFAIYDEQVEENTPSQCQCKKKRLSFCKMYYVQIIEGFNIKIGKEQQ